MGRGEYWYYGLENCIKDVLQSVLPLPHQAEELSLSFNIDGLPINRSSKQEFWPILCMVQTKNQQFEPQAVAIYSGIGKPPLESYLTPFVNELNTLLRNGLNLEQQTFNLKINNFVCDTPARCFIKNTSYFNSYHGCSKCCVLGEYDRQGHHMFYASVDAPLRTDTSFRQKSDPDHHKGDTPLQNLPIDLISDFPIADSLHLIDLGIMKKCLLAWISGSFGYGAKWSARDISNVSEHLVDCNQQMPLEIHRAVRTLDCIKFWKALEFRTFLLYLGPVVLKDMLEPKVYEHFLTFFCAVTLCTTRCYLKAINVAEKLFLKYVKEFSEVYNKESISSNVHGLCHIVEDVKRFGCLPLFSAYPFENKLFQIKCLIRSGNKPLTQVAKRMQEISSFINHNTVEKTDIYPLLKNARQMDNNTIYYERVYPKEGVILSAERNQDKWFMTQEKEIMCIISAKMIHEKVYVKCRAIKLKHSFFEQPFESSFLNIFISDGILNDLTKEIDLNCFKCKLLKLNCKNNFVFLPLLHSLPDD